MSDDLVKQVKALDDLDLAGLRAEYQRIYGVEPVSRNVTALRQQLQRKLTRMDIDARKKERAKGGKAATDTPAADSPRSITDRLTALTKMSLEELRTEFEAVIGKKSRSRNRTQLVKKIAEKLQQDSYTEKMAGGAKPTLTVTAKFDRKRKNRSKRVAKPEAKKDGESKRAQHREPGQRDPRLPKAGTTIERVYKGKKLLVRVLDEGFEHEGKPYRSLSALAQAITGAKAINGYLFFALGDYAKQEKASK
jgi:hypothetical protein